MQKSDPGIISLSVIPLRQTVRSGPGLPAEIMPPDPKIGAAGRIVGVMYDYIKEKPRRQAGLFLFFLIVWFW